MALKMDYHCNGCGHDFDGAAARCPRCLKRSTVVAATEVPAPAGEKHLTANAWLMVLMAVFSALSSLSVLINFFLAASGVGVAATGGTVETVSALATFACIGAWAVLGVVWTPINAWGLFKRKSWARKSTLLYWAGAALTCGCLPVAVYGLWSLTRADVVRATYGWE